MVESETYPILSYRSHVPSIETENRFYLLKYLENLKKTRNVERPNFQKLSMLEVDFFRRLDEERIRLPRLTLEDASQRDIAVPQEVITWMRKYNRSFLKKYKLPRGIPASIPRSVVVENKLTLVK